MLIRRNARARPQQHYLKSPKTYDRHVHKQQSTCLQYEVFTQWETRQNKSKIQLHLMWAKAADTDAYCRIFISKFQKQVKLNYSVLGLTHRVVKSQGNVSWGVSKITRQQRLPWAARNGDERNLLRCCQCFIYLFTLHFNNFIKRYNPLVPKHNASCLGYLCLPQN